MMQSEAARFIDQLYIHILKRPPGKKELAFWTDLAMQQTPLAILTAFTTSKEYLNKRAVASTFTPGHYHSPVVDPSTVVTYHARSRAEQAEDLHGIQLDLPAMLSFWDAHLAFTAAFPFREEKTSDQRFHFDGSPYPWGDAITLRTMIHAYKPKRIIEIGSGFSTACMLNSADECGLDTLQITCIEPYPDRLHSLMREADYARVKVCPIPVQDMEPADVDALNAGDFLFIELDTRSQNRQRRAFRIVPSPAAPEAWRDRARSRLPVSIRISSPVGIRPQLLLE